MNEKGKTAKLVLLIKNVVFWDVALCRSCLNRRFGGTYRLHLQGRRIRERGTSVSRWLHTANLTEFYSVYHEEGEIEEGAGGGGGGGEGETYTFVKFLMEN
jgi:hypothetical protein